MNKRAFSFTLDVTLGVVIVLLILSLASFYVGRNEVDIFPQLQISKTGGDLLNVLDRMGYLDPPMDVEMHLNNLLPGYYGMNITSVGGNCTFNVGENPPDGVFIASGIRYFTIKHDTYFEYCSAEYKIWQE